MKGKINSEEKVTFSLYYNEETRITVIQTFRKSVIFFRTDCIRYTGYDIRTNG